MQDGKFLHISWLILAPKFISSIRVLVINFYYKWNKSFKLVLAVFSIIWRFLSDSSVEM